MDATPAGPLFDSSGGHPALDFANTLGSRPDQPGSPRVEHLRAYADLLAWTRQAGLVDEAAERSLRARAVERPDEAAAVLSRATALREALYRIFSAGAVERGPAPADLDRLNDEIGSALGAARLTWDGAAFAWGWRSGSDDLASVLRPVVRAAADLLTSADRARVRECAADWCAWLFLDRSHAGRRQWCDMKVCGNRAKARRHYARLKERESRP